MSERRIASGESGVRAFTIDDLDACSEIAAEVWPVIRRLGTTDEQSKALMSAYVGMSLVVSDYAKVYLHNGTVQALLFGRISGRRSGRDTVLIKKKIRADFLAGRYGKRTRILKFLLLLMITETKVKKCCRRIKSELVLFFVSSGLQGKGFGTMMLDGFIAAVKKAGKDSIFLYTDTESNWQFYERKGFKKIREFYDNGLSCITGRKTRSFIYVFSPARPAGSG